MMLLLRAVAGLLLWAITFNLLYGVHGIGCASGWDGRMLGPFSLYRVAMVTVWLLGTAATVAWYWHERHATGFVGGVTRGVAMIGIVATIVTGLPVVVFPACT